MADSNTPLVNTARAIGNTVGRMVSAVTGGSEASEGAQGSPPENLWQAEYLGSGTFIFHKPKRKARKRRQQALKGPRPGMRK